MSEPVCPEVVTLGEALAMFAPTDIGPMAEGATFRLGIAGAELNVAIGLRRLGHVVRWIGRVANDSLGNVIIQRLKAEGVDTSHVQIDREATTALLLKEMRTADLVRVSYHRTGSAGSRLAPSDVTPEAIGRPRLLHLSGITARLSDTAYAAAIQSVRLAVAAGARISLDVNYRRGLGSIETARTALDPLLDHTQLVFASEDELGILTDRGNEAESIDLLHRRGVEEVVVKRGHRGATAYTVDGSWDQPARAVRAVDPVGAGDAFVAGYLSGWLSAADLPGRMSLAALTGAFAVSTTGDWAGLPTRDELTLLDAEPGTVLR